MSRKIQSLLWLLLLLLLLLLLWGIWTSQRRLQQLNKRLGQVAITTFTTK